MPAVLHDLAQSLRNLWQTPRFTLAAVLTLALGIGANTAIFSVINAVLLKPLPYEQPGRLMVLRENKLPETPDFSVSAGNFADWRKQNAVFEQLAAFHTPPYTLTGQGEPEQFRGARVSSNLFPILGIRPVLGRTFLSGEEEPGKDAVVLLSHAFWQRRFGGSAAALGAIVTLNGRGYEVVGVMPPAFAYPRQDIQVWTPLALRPQDLQSHDNHFLTVLGRLRPGSTAAQAGTEMNAIARRLAADYPETNTGRGVRVVRLLDYLVGYVRPTLWVLMGAVVLVLLIACANTANLLLARAIARGKELAIRTALGADRWQIVRQMLTESLLLTALGAALGILLAWGGLGVLLGLVPAGIPRLSMVRVDAWVLGFTFVTALLTTLLFGLVPALHASRANPAKALSGEGRSASGTRESHRMRSTLVVTEVAMALMLLVGASLMLTSLLKLKAVDPGFNPKQVLTLRMSLPGARYTTPAQRARFAAELLQKLWGLPGVKHAALGSPLPFQGHLIEEFCIDGRPPVKRSEWPSTSYAQVSPEYFQAMRIPLLKGRAFSEMDREGAGRVAIINQSLARRFFPREDPVGKRINVDNEGDETVWREIVGVVGDTRQDGLQSESPVQTYEPIAQKPTNYLSIVLRTDLEPLSLAGPVRAQVASLDRNLAVSNITTLEQVLQDATLSERFSAALLGVFAGLALVLASIGIFSVVSYLVSQRTREFGIRVALGALASQVIWEAIRKGMVLAGFGLGLGIAGALAAGRLLASLLFTVRADDPLTLTLSALVLGLTSLVACLIPASRAARVDPAVVLRNE